MRFLFALFFSKAVLFLSNLFFNGGTNFPGKIALKLDKNILNKLSENYKVIMITGTNGKTTTTSMIYNILKNNNDKVITNSTGANMLTGIVSCFVKNFSFSKSSKTAIIEVDEANLKLVTEYIKPEIITITNLFRDQMDRYGEVYTTLKKIEEGIKKTPDSILVLNGDESFFGDMNVSNEKVFYGFKCKLDTKETNNNVDAKYCIKCKTPYDYEFTTYNHLGNYTCPNCGYSRPKLNFFVDKIQYLNPKGSHVKICNKDFYINQPGSYNIYNALSAYSTVKLLGIDDEIIDVSFSNLKSSFGRQESINIKGKNLKIILVKNPAGFDEAINSVNLDECTKSLAVLLNDNYADGKDVSWIWDVNFETLDKSEIDDVLISGIRLYDMSIRLKVAGLNENMFRLCNSYDKLLNSIESNKNENIYMLATYTAMTSFRKFLNNKGYLKKLW
ncbi:DUF1727 domain-containing protein [Clostridium sp. DL1XJH146]